MLNIAIMTPTGSPQQIGGAHGAPRATQRLPRSCTTCRRRRVKCTQTIPCGPCVASKQAHLCQREIVMWKGKLSIAMDDETTREVPDEKSLVKENSALRERIMQLEAALIMGRDGLHGTAHTGPSSEGRQVEDFAQTEKARADNFESFENTLERLHGIKPDSMKKPISGMVGVVDQKYYRTLSILPAESSSRSIARFSLATLGWIHCAVRSDLFLQEHDAFWSALNKGDYSVLGNHSWLAVYFSVLTTGLQFMDQEDGVPVLEFANPLGPFDAVPLAKRCYDHALEQLHESNFLDEPRLETVQTIAILTLSFRLYDGDEKELLLLGVAINAARCIKMNRLGSETSYASTAAERPEWSTASGRELGRRLWWTLVICDWLGPLTRPPSISPVSFDCLLTIGSMNYDICGDTIPDNQSPSALHHHMVTAKLAYVFYYFVKSDRDRSPRNIAKAVKEIDSTWDRLPSFFRTDATTVGLYENEPAWVSFQQYMIVFGFHFSKLMLCRPMFERWLSGDTSKDVTWLHTVAIDSASGIISHAESSVPAFFNRGWVISSAIVSAGVTLALDLLCFHQLKTEAVVLEQRSLLQSCLGHLSQFASNKNIQSAVNILTNTLRLHEISSLPEIRDTATLELALRHLSKYFDVDDMMAGSILPSFPPRSSTVNPGRPNTEYFENSTMDTENGACLDIFQAIDFLNVTTSQGFPWSSLDLDFNTEWISE